MAEEMLLVAIGCSWLPGMLEISEKHASVVFGTMDGQTLVDFADSVSGDSATELPVYFYESG